MSDKSFLSVIRLLYIFIIFLILLFFSSSICFALGDPKLISTINSAFKDIESWILKIATPAAAVWRPALPVRG